MNLPLEKHYFHTKLILIILLKLPRHLIEVIMPKHSNGFDVLFHFTKHNINDMKSILSRISFDEAINAKEFSLNRVDILNLQLNLKKTEFLMTDLNETGTITANDRYLLRIEEVM